MVVQRPYHLDNDSHLLRSWRESITREMKSLSTTVATVTGSTTTSGQDIIGVTSTASLVTITLRTLDMQKGKVMYIKDQSGGASINNITIDTQGSETIDGLNLLKITANYGVLKIYSDGSNWYTL